MAKVEVRLKDGGTSISIEGKPLRGRQVLVMDDSSNVGRLRKAGLITTKELKEADPPASQPEPPEDIEPVTEEVTTPAVSETQQGQGNTRGNRTGNGNRHNRPGSGKQTTLQT